MLIQSVVMVESYMQFQALLEKKYIYKSAKNGKITQYADMYMHN